jgi:dTDP-glucose 4,6-dehydratase
MILNALEGKALPIYSDGRNVRDWLHVRDHATAVWAVMTRAKAGTTYCVGGRNELRNLEVVNQICELVDAQAPALPSGEPRRSLITFVKDRPGHDHRYAIDCSLLEGDLGWRQEESAETGFAKTVEWYLGNPEWVDAVRSGAYRNWIDTNYTQR